MINNKIQPPHKLTSIFNVKCLLRKLVKNHPKVALLRLEGAIGSAGAFKASINLETMYQNIEDAFKIVNLKAVFLLINSPGGSPVQSELIYKRIRNLADERKIPVISCIEDIAASGGYFLACTGDEIYASESSIIGSIGVISHGFGFEDAIQKLGIKRRIYTQGKNKSILDPYLPEKESDIKIIKEVQKDVFDSFKQLVVLRRGEKLNVDHNKLFNGEFWSGKKALEYGLIDNIGDYYSIIKEKFGSKVKIIRLNKGKSWLKRKLGLSISQITDNLASSLIKHLLATSKWYNNLN